MPKAENLILAGGFALLAAALVMGVWSWSETAATRGWRTVEGRVIESRAECQRVRTRYGQGITYVPVVRYAYDVAGEGLTSRRVYPGTPRQWTEEAELAAFLADHYPPGARVTVHYDPQDPHEAALRIESDYGLALVLGGTGLWFALMGWGLRALARRQ